MTKYSAFGTVLARTTAPSGTIAQVKSITGPGLKLDTVDVTTHDSSGGWEEVVGTILRSGEVRLELLYDPAAATHKNASGGLIYALAQRSKVTYTLTFPDTTVWTFDAYVTAFEPSAPHEGALTATVTLKLTGQPTLA
jgi:predicted secreted protein